MSVTAPDLTVPPGDPTSLWRAATGLRAISAAVSATALVGVRGGVVGLGASWSGAAADEARAEVNIVGGRVSDLAARLTAAATQLSNYGTALDTAQRTCHGLQGQWDSASRLLAFTEHTAMVVPPGLGGAGSADGAPSAPSAPSPLEQARSAATATAGRLATDHATAMAHLESAGNAAAAALSVLAAQGGGLPATARGALTQLSDLTGAVERTAVAGLDDAAIRSQTLAGLPIVLGAVGAFAADGRAGQVAATLQALAGQTAGPGGDGAPAPSPSDLQRTVQILGENAHDPLFAQALLDRLGATGLTDAVTALASPLIPPADPDSDRSQRTALLAALGVTLAAAVDPRRAGGLDPVNAHRLDRWREPFLAQLAAGVGQVRDRREGRVGGAWAQGQLLATLVGQGGPGALYASTVGVAIVEAERGRRGRMAVTSGPDPMHYLSWVGGQHAVVDPAAGDDAVVALLRSVEGDTGATQALLLAPLSTSAGSSGAGLVRREDGALTGDVRVLDYLVRDRYRLYGLDAAASAGAVSALVLSSGADPSSTASVHLTARYLDAVGQEALTTTDPDRLRAAMAPVTSDLALLLGSHPDALLTTLRGERGVGADADALTSEHRFVLDSSVSGDPGRHDIVLRDRDTEAALVGLLPFDGTDRDAGSSPDTARPVAQLLGTLGAHEDAALVEAIRRDYAGDEHALDVAAHQAGSTAGFVIATAGTSLAGAQADADARNAALLTIADGAVDLLPGGGGVGTVVVPLAKAAASDLLASALPTDSAARQQAATAGGLSAAENQAAGLSRDLVSRAAPWRPDQAPDQWAARQAATGATSPSVFWDAAGHPLPERTMTTDQLRAYDAWRHDEALSVYDAVPLTIREGVVDGAREALPSTSR